MKRLRLRVSTLMLLVVIVALGFELVMQERRHRGREAELAERLQVEKELKNVRVYLHKQEMKELQGKLGKLGRFPSGIDGDSDGK